MNDSRSKIITVADIDPLIRCYHVVCRGRDLGTKFENDYRKPDRTRKNPEDYYYKSAPPWFNREVIKISLGRNDRIEVEVK